MAYRLSLADGVPASVRACAREQLETAVAQLEQPGGDRAAAIHDARKALKKARSLLRLVQGARGAKGLRRERDALRDAGRALSATRDTDALLETVDKLAEHAAGRVPAVELTQLREALATDAATAADGDGSAAADPAAVAQTLRGLASAVDDWPLARADWAVVGAGAARTYARGRAALAAVHEEPSAERLHEWRKRVKDLWYQLRLLAPAWPDVLDAHAQAAHALADLLGDDHDLTVLRERLERGIALPPQAGADVPALLALVDERRAELQAAALRLGARLYAEPPNAYGRRLGRILDAAVAEQREGGAA